MHISKRVGWSRVPEICSFGEKDVSWGKAIAIVYRGHDKFRVSQPQRSGPVLFRLGNFLIIFDSNR